MKRFNIFLFILLIVVMLGGCADEKKTAKKEMINITVIQDGVQLESAGYDMMITVDGEEITAKKNENGYSFEKLNGEIKGSVKFPDWVEVEYGFVNDGSYKDVSLTVCFEHRENELYASQKLTAVKNGEAVELFEESFAGINESRLSVFAKGGN